MDDNRSTYVSLRSPSVAGGFKDVRPMLRHLGRMLGHVGSMLGQFLAYVGPMLAYVRPMLAHVEPAWKLCWGHVWAIYVETILRC